MSLDWTYLLLLLPVAPLVRDDFRSREVAVAWLAVVGVVTVAVGWIEVGWRGMLLHTGLNLCLLGLLGGAMALWSLLRRRPLRGWFGAGDVVMLLLLTPLFAPDAYVRFLLAACLAALGWWCVRRCATLPFAGFMALTLMGYAMLKAVEIWR